MFKRSLTPHIKSLAKKYPVVTLYGPRQSGKTTLIKQTFPDKPYVNLEDPDSRFLATEDPTGFMASYPDGVILDEIQRVPKLLSYIQVTVDEKDQKGMYILTGSHQAKLHEAVSQSLAGRTTVLRLLPLSLSEMRSSDINDPIDDIILKGGYPKIYRDNLPIANAYSSYFQTYVERDVRQLLQIKNILHFERFVKLIASRIGQIINYSSLASDVGVSANTIKEWVAVLEATYILVRLEPYFENFGKRLIKSPKIYFTDTGLACHILGIESVNQLKNDPIYGNLFENLIVLELMKARFNQALDPNLYFYRDVTGREVDLISRQGSFLVPIEIKSNHSFNASFLKGLNDFHNQAAKRAKGGALVYMGKNTQKVGPYSLYTPESCSNIVNQISEKG